MKPDLLSRALLLLLPLLLIAACADAPPPTPPTAAGGFNPPQPAPGTGGLNPPPGGLNPPTDEANPPTPPAPPGTGGLNPPTDEANPPLPAPPAPRARPRMGTFFFYWHDCPRNECDPSQLSVVPPGWLTPLPADPDPRDGTAYSSRNYDWYEGELREMQRVGVELVLPVSWGDHPHPWFRNEQLDLLVQANGILARPLPIGMFLDTTAQQGMYNDFLDAGYRYGPGTPQLPLSDPRSGYFFYERHIKGFFERIPRAMWATEQGRPLIVAYTTICCRDLQLSGELWAAVKAAFARDFGVTPWLILEETWFTPEAVAPPEGLAPLGQVADGRYRWGTALNGPAVSTLGDFTVASVGPGFDNRRIAGIADPRHQPRDEPPGGGPPAEGAFLRASLASVPDDADLLLIETWNEWPEGSGVARAAYLGRDGRALGEDFYLQIIRAWRQRE